MKDKAVKTKYVADDEAVFIVVAATEDWSCIHISKALAKYLGYLPKEVINKKLQLIMDKTSFAKLPRVMDKKNSKAISYEELRFRRKDSSFIRLHTVEVVSLDAAKPALFIVLKNLDEQKRAEEALRNTYQEIERIGAEVREEIAKRSTIEEALKKSEKYYETVFENAGAPMAILEEDMTMIKINKEWERVYGYTKQDIEGSKWPPLFTEEYREKMIGYHYLRRQKKSNAPLRYNSRIIDKYGKERDCLVVVDVIPGTKLSVAAFVDLSEIKRVNRAYKANSAVNTVMLHADSIDELLHEVCRRIVDIGGYLLAWVGISDENTEYDVVPLAYAGREEGYLKAKGKTSLKDPEKGYGPAGIAIKSEKTYICRNIEKDLTTARWWSEAVKRGYKAVISLPLYKNDHKIWGALTIYSGKEDVFDDEEVNLLTEMAGDLSYGIAALSVRLEKDIITDELKDSLDKMHRVLHQTVDALGNLLEFRDPYTAGHQERVARLAKEIAVRMNLSPQIIEGISVAGALHDIGKIAVPGEILSKPGDISRIETMLIKEHSTAGYEIIKDIEFPWPIGQIVLQHHERMDGSGYPQGLKGEEILLEARILAVADTVEAMSSFRPYRMALGVDKALEEIRQNKGVLYDPAVVDKCLQIFKENKEFLDQKA